MSYLDFPALRPIKHLLVEPDVSEIMINGISRLFVERSGRMTPHPPVFHTQHQLEALVEALVGMTGRAVTTLSPFVDFRLPDGSRVNVAVRPVALDGPVVTIRRASEGIGSLEALVKRQALTKSMATFLCACVSARLNILFAGGTGSGKTTLLGLLSQYIPEQERIVVIEDTAELMLSQPNVVRLECRPPNIEGAGAITLTDLLKNSLRMRPTRIILGEVRGEEAFDLLSAMSSGHDGGFAVVHASSPRDAVSRIVMMVLSRGLPLPLWAIHSQFAAGIDLIVQHAQLSDGRRVVTHMAAVQGTKDEHVVLQDLFTFHTKGVDQEGRVDGKFSMGKVPPVWMDRVQRAAPELVRGLFEEHTSAKRAAG